MGKGIDSEVGRKNTKWILRHDHDIGEKRQINQGEQAPPLLSRRPRLSGEV